MANTAHTHPTVIPSVPLAIPVAGTAIPLISRAETIVFAPHLTLCATAFAAIFLRYVVSLALREFFSVGT